MPRDVEDTDDVEFAQFPYWTRRAALRAAKRGEMHSDPDVAKASLVWAQDVLSARRVPGDIVAGAADLVTALAGAGGGVLTGKRRADRKAAERIIFAARRNGLVVGDDG